VALANEELISDPFKEDDAYPGTKIGNIDTVIIINKAIKQVTKDNDNNEIPDIGSAELGPELFLWSNFKFLLEKIDAASYKFLETNFIAI
jgi:hypothetical protein